MLATPAEGLAGRFTKMDKKKFGIIPGVTDKEYYTNSNMSLSTITAPRNTRPKWRLLTMR